jgi:hypothetical protein
MDKIIVHISGASGSGKTVLGNKLNSYFKGSIIVKDLDDLRDEFIQKFYGNNRWTYIDENEYQDYIDNYINRQKRSIIFVGLNDNTLFGKNKRMYYDVHSQYNYYIDIDDMTIVKQKCTRLISDIQNDKHALNNLVQDNAVFLKLFIQGIKRECGVKETIKMNNRWKKYYTKHGYKLMSKENIYKDVIKLIIP